jgi:selenocysteine-specific elongation factor
MIIGTAGHIDHGKTTLVRALTGVDTDRLKEEKARGISIELGYAYTPLGNGDVLGIVDVPGHERLVQTMVAGACGIDFALLVIAADDGVMPQTREHLDILQLLGITRGAIALTKIDRVDGERLRAVEAAVTASLAGTALAGAPIFPLIATAPDDPGIRELRQHLQQAACGKAAERVPMRCAHRADSPPSEKLFRLAVDRVFTLAGHGTIAAGTVFSGRVHVGDTVTLMPAGRAVRVRSIHAQNRPADSGCAGQRCALNLVGIEKSAIARGDWLADPQALASTTRIDARLRLLANGGSELRSWSAVHLHVATAHTIAHVVPLDAERLRPGDCARVQLVVSAPLCCAPADRLIVRDTRAARTIGGGVVLDPFAPARRRRSAERLRYLDALEAMIAGEGVAPLLECAPAGLATSDLARLTGVATEHLALPTSAVTLNTEHQRFVVLCTVWRAWRERALSCLHTFHTEIPDEPGPDSARLRRIVAPNLPGALWRKLIDELVQARAIVRNGAWLQLPEHVVVLSPSDQALAKRVRPLIEAGRFDPPWVRELAAAVHEPQERVRQVLRKELILGSIYQVVRDLFYDAGRVHELAVLAAGLAHEHKAIDAARFRDALGIGRKRTIQILEFFDRVGYTRRVRDLHVLREDSAWHVPPKEPRKVYEPGGATGLQTQKGAADASW